MATAYAEDSGVATTGSNAPRRRRRAATSTAHRLLSSTLLSIPLVLLTLWTVIPFLITLSISFKQSANVFAHPGLIPQHPSVQSWTGVLSSSGFRTSLVNSVVVGIGTTVLTLVISVPAAYAFARFRFRGRHLLLLFTLLPRLVPSLGLMIPLYRMAVFLGVLDHRLTLIVVYSGLVVPLAVWLLVGFYQKIPRDMEEAASVDGANMWKRIRFVVLPLSTPALITIAVLAFREAWNEFTLVLVLTSQPGTRTLPYELYVAQGNIDGIPDYPAIAAFALLTIIPFLLVYMRIERHVVQGITAGSGK